MPRSLYNCPHYDNAACSHPPLAYTFTHTRKPSTVKIFDPDSPFPDIPVAVFFDVTTPQLQFFLKTMAYQATAPSGEQHQ